MSYKRPISKSLIKDKLLLTEPPYKKDVTYKKLMAEISRTGQNDKSISYKKKDLKATLQNINNEIHFTNEPIIKSLHESNINFKNEYKLFNKQSHKKETKEIFKDLVKLYQQKGYRIPNFSINNHNLFKINPLIEENEEKMTIGLLEKQMDNKGKKDSSEKIMEYLKKLGQILSDKMSLDPEKHKNIFEKFTMPKLRIKISDDNDIDVLKKKIEIINNLINTNALSKMDEKPKKNVSFSRSSSNANKSSRNLHSCLKNRNIINKQNSNITKRRFSNCSVNFVPLPINKKENSSKEKNIINRNIKLSNNSNNYMRLNSNNIKKTHTLHIKSNLSTNKNNNNKLSVTFLQSCQNSSRKNSGNSNINFISERSDKKAYSIHSSMTINFGKIKNYMNIEKNKNKIILNKNNCNGKLSLFNKTQTNDSKINDYSEDYLLLANSPKNKSKLAINHRKNTSINFPYNSEKEFVDYAYDKLSKRRNLNTAEKLIKKYFTKIKGYDNAKAENAIKGIYLKTIKNNVIDLKNQIIKSEIYPKTERLYVNSHKIKRIKPLLDNMEKNDITIERFDKSFTNAISCK